MHRDIGHKFASNPREHLHKQMSYAIKIAIIKLRDFGAKRKNDRHQRTYVLYYLTEILCKPVEFDGFRSEAGLHAFTMSPTKWIESVNAKMPYGRRSNEKIQGTRNEYHIVKQDEYDLFDGAHEAIISENDFRLAAQKRKETGVKREKTHSLEHEHILSGILRCPVCHGSMYSNVNRKKKAGVS